MSNIYLVLLLLPKSHQSRSVSLLCMHNINLPHSVQLFKQNRKGDLLTRILNTLRVHHSGTVGVFFTSFHVWSFLLWLVSQVKSGHVRLYRIYIYRTCLKGETFVDPCMSFIFAADQSCSQVIALYCRMFTLPCMYTTAVCKKDIDSDCKSSEIERPLIIFYI